MERRGFLGLLGSAALAPALPALPVAPVAQVAAKRTGYSGLLYGMAKFHAQTRAGLTAADLMPRLGVSAAKAQALIAELTAKGVLSPVAATAARVGAAQVSGSATATNLQDKLTTELKRTVSEAMDDTPETEASAEETDNAKV